MSSEMNDLLVDLYPEPNDRPGPLAVGDKLVRADDPDWPHIYMLVCAGTSTVAAVNVSSGRRWMGAHHVGSNDEITAKEAALILGRDFRTAWRRVARAGTSMRLVEVPGE